MCESYFKLLVNEITHNTMSCPSLFPSLPLQSQRKLHSTDYSIELYLLLKSYYYYECV